MLCTVQVCSSSSQWQQSLINSHGKIGDRKATRCFASFWSFLFHVLDIGTHFSVFCPLPAMVGLAPLAPSIQYSCRGSAAQYTLIQSSLGVIYMLHRSQKFILNVSRHTMFIIFQFVQPHPNLMKVEIFCEITHSNMGNGLARLPATLLIGWDRPSFYLISYTPNHKASQCGWFEPYSTRLYPSALCCAVPSR